MKKPQPSVCAILLAGGIGARMRAEQPKQLLTVGAKPLARHSFDLLLNAPAISEIVVVCEPALCALFNAPQAEKPVFFALPGARRQDSTYNGMQAASKLHDFICIHDAARPFIDTAMINRALQAAQQHGAATVGMPVKFTVKQSCASQFVQNTPDRATIWEIQTPQVIRHEWLIEGFQYALSNDLTVTDDVSLVELIGKPVKLVEGAHTNLKVTVPADLTFANHLYAALNTHSPDAT